MKIAKIGLTAVVAVAMISAAVGRLARAANVFNADVPVSFTVTNPCNGEDVLFSGTAHVLVDITINGNTAHLGVNTNFQDLSGVGLTTGAKYQLANSTHTAINQDIP